MKQFLTILCCSLLLGASAQKLPEVWDLQQCINYAVQNNISIKQADITARISQLQALQAKYNQYPNLSGSASNGVRFGRSIDPTTNTFATSQFLYQNFGVNAGMQLYNNGRLKYTEQAVWVIFSEGFP